MIIIHVENSFLHFLIFSSNKAALVSRRDFI